MDITTITDVYREYYADRHALLHNDSKLFFFSSAKINVAKSYYSEHSQYIFCDVKCCLFTTCCLL